MGMIDSNVLDLPGSRGVLLRLLVGSVLDACLTALQAGCLAYAIVGLWGGRSIDVQLPWIVAFLLCYLLRQLIGYYRSWMMDGFAGA